MSFEDALRELEAIVETLEQGRGSLDDAIAAYERGAALKKHCQKKLEEGPAQGREDQARREWAAVRHHRFRRLRRPFDGRSPDAAGGVRRHGR